MFKKVRGQIQILSKTSFRNVPFVLSHNLYHKIGQTNNFNPNGYSRGSSMNIQQKIHLQLQHCSYSNYSTPHNRYLFSLSIHLHLHLLSSPSTPFRFHLFPPSDIYTHAPITLSSLPVLYISVLFYTFILLDILQFSLISAKVLDQPYHSLQMLAFSLLTQWCYASHC